MDTHMWEAAAELANAAAEEMAQAPIPPAELAASPGPAAPKTPRRPSSKAPEWSPPPPRAKHGAAANTDKNDKMGMILELLGHKTEAMNSNFERLHERMQRRDAEIDERFNDVDSKINRVKHDIAAADATAKATFASLEERVGNLEEARTANPSTSADGEVPPRQRNTVVIGGWPQDTDRKTILSELHRWLSENAIRVSATWVPGPRHFLAKIRFATARDAWVFLDARPEFDGKWISIERRRTESAQRRPILEAQTREGAPPRVPPCEAAEGRGPRHHLAQRHQDLGEGGSDVQVDGPRPAERAEGGAAAAPRRAAVVKRPGPGPHHRAAGSQVAGALMEHTRRTRRRGEFAGHHDWRRPLRRGRRFGLPGTAREAEAEPVVAQRLRHLLAGLHG